MSAGTVARRASVIGGAAGVGALAIAGLTWFAVAVGYAAYSLWECSHHWDELPALALECRQCGCRSADAERCEVCGSARFAGKSW